MVIVGRKENPHLRLPQKSEDFIEFDSVINFKPFQGNRSRGVEDAKTQAKIKRIVEKLILR